MFITIMFVKMKDLSFQHKKKTHFPDQVLKSGTIRNLIDFEYIVYFLQVSSRSQLMERVHYLLDTGYPVSPLMPTTPLVQPAATEYPEEEETQYEDMEGALQIKIESSDEKRKCVNSPCVLQR